MTNQPPGASNARQAIRTFHYGLHILSCGQGAEAHAATVTWVTQVSMRPRRVAVAVRKDSHVYQAIKQHGVFALNVVGEGQEDLASAFFKYVAPDGHTFAGYAFEDGPASGAPLFLDAVAWLECRTVEEANAGGDHGLFVADVLAGAIRPDAPKALSLASTGWSYGG